MPRVTFEFYVVCVVQSVTRGDVFSTPTRGAGDGGGKWHRSASLGLGHGMFRPDGRMLHILSAVISQESMAWVGVCIALTEGIRSTGT